METSGFNNVAVDDDLASSRCSNGQGHYLEATRCIAATPGNRIFAIA
jgi:hypothetical protein